MFKKILREPLIHFLLIGGLLFYIYGQQNSGFEKKENSIVITQANLDRLVLQWKKKNFREPTKTDIDVLLEKYIHDEVMYREAIAMGLDKNDLVIRRRLSQKLEFLSSDIVDVVEPTQKELQVYLDNNSKRFMLPGKMSFLQIYIDVNKHNKSYIKELYLELKKGTSYKKLGDDFLLSKEFQNVTKHDISKIFGRAFSQELFSLHVDSWQGPIVSGYGLHLVKIQKREDEKIASLQSVKNIVRKEWKVTQRENVNRAIYENLKSQYSIKLPKDIDVK